MSTCDIASRSRIANSDWHLAILFAQFVNFCCALLAYGLSNSFAIYEFSLLHTVLHFRLGLLCGCRGAWLLVNMQALQSAEIIQSGAEMYLRPCSNDVMGPKSKDVIYTWRDLWQGCSDCMQQCF